MGILPINGANFESISQSMDVCTKNQKLEKFNEATIDLKSNHDGKKGLRDSDYDEDEEEGEQTNDI